MRITQNVAVRISAWLLIFNIPVIVMTIMRWPALTDATLFEIVGMLLPFLMPVVALLVLRGRPEDDSLRSVVADTSRTQRILIGLLALVSGFLWFAVLSRLTPLRDTLNALGTISALANLAYSVGALYAAAAFSSAAAREIA